MASQPPVYIAGIGITILKGRLSEATQEEITISAATKALLDAGVTYSEVNYSFAGTLEDDLKVPKRTFQSFGTTGAPIIEVDCLSGLFLASQCVRSGSANVALMVGFDRV